MVSKITAKIISFLTCQWIVFLGKTFSINYVISYLRKPNPLITVKILKKFGAKIGERTTIKRSLFLDNVFEDESSTGDFSHIQLGKNCYVGDCVYFDLSNEVILEDNSVVSGRVSFITHSDCNRSEFLNKEFPRKSNKIIIRQGAWIGFGACILDGVVVDKESTVSAGSLVNSNVESRTLYGGIPAKFIKKL